MNKSHNRSNTLTLSPSLIARFMVYASFCLLIVACSTEKKTTDHSNKSAPTSTVSGSTPIVPVPTVSNPKENPSLTKQQLFSDTLGAHNRVRAKHGLKPLTWSPKLAKYSQEWANHLGTGPRCKMFHRPGTPAFGENLYRSTAKVWEISGVETSREHNPVTITNVVKAWADEEQWYNYQTNSCQRGKLCGHYTQIVWKNTTQVGCAVKYCGDKSQTWVCSYNPPGNYQGVRPY